MVSEDDFIHMDELSFAIYDIGAEEVEKFDPDSDQRAFYEALPKGGPEDAVSILYEESFDWAALNINHRRHPGALKYALGFEDQSRSPSHAPTVPESLIESIQSEIEQHYSDDSSESGLDIIDRIGIPDFLAYPKENPSRFEFVEVKFPPEDLDDSQRKWLDRFDFLPRKLACVFKDPGDRDQFVREKSFEALLEAPAEENEPRPEMDSSEIASALEDVEIGDRLLFNDRKQPLTVVEKDATTETLGHEVTGVKVSSRKGSIVLSRDGEWFAHSMYRRSLWWVNVLDEDS